MRTSLPQLLLFYCALFLIICMPLRGEAAGTDGVTLYAVPGKKPGRSPGKITPCDLVAIAQSREIMVDTTTYPPDTSRAGSWLNNASLGRTAVFSKAFIEHYKVSYSHNGQPLLPYGGIDIFVIQFSKKAHAEEAQKAIKSGLNPKGPLYNFWQTSKGNTLYLLAYHAPGIHKGNSLLQLAQELALQCAQ